ncbi:MAG: hypothetical protein Kow00127_04470 [Bacteroidales bacterium]
MKRRLQIRLNSGRRFRDKRGEITLALFLIAVVSGFFLAFVYNPDEPWKSVSFLMITNPAGVLIRNIHYWSSQLLLILSFWHAWDYFQSENLKKLSPGVWFRLLTSLGIILYLMLSGFILKGDPEAQQAHRIFESLLAAVPGADSLWIPLFSGSQDNLSVIYLNHIAIGTILLGFIIYEHSNKLISGFPLTLFMLSLVTLISIFVSPVLSDHDTQSLKGPWFFIGLQEILHWFSKPAAVDYFLILFLIALFIIRRCQVSCFRLVKSAVIILAAFYGITTLSGSFLRGKNWQWEPFTGKASYRWVQFHRFPGLPSEEVFSLSENDLPEIRGRYEGCLACHQEMQGFSPSHDPMATGCQSCHGGNAYSGNKNRAHSDLKRVPGNLEDAEQSCGTTDCHPGITERVRKSLMTTNAGIVKTDRWAFGADTTYYQTHHIAHLGRSGADLHLRNLCSKCHLGRTKVSPAPIDESQRGGGCIACHLSYSDTAGYQLALYQAFRGTDSLLPQFHPKIGLPETNEACFGCHSRSGRISLSYEGWHETLLEERDTPDTGSFRVLNDGRVLTAMPADIHHKAALLCVDCHDATEVMGNGEHYSRQSEALRIQCTDCHREKVLSTGKAGRLGQEESKIYRLRGFEHPKEDIVTRQKDEQPLINVLATDTGIYLIGKQSGEIHPVKPPAPVCTNKTVHSRLTCDACHTGWAPQCIGCHNRFEPETPGYDLLDDHPVKGSWVEFTGLFLAEQPTLGVMDTGTGSIVPAIPGMIMTIDPSDTLNKKQFLRLFSPAVPHTTQAKGRGCASCHLNPLAVGYGRGNLTAKALNNGYEWFFSAQFADSEYDDLPEDAWTGFPGNAKDLHNPPFSTHPTFRPFNTEEQEAILRFGACLLCHDEESEVVRQSLVIPFDSLISKMQKTCYIPDFSSR